MSPEALARNAAEKGMKALAITEHGNVYSWVHFAKACKKHGVKPIFGLEAYVARKSSMQPMDKFAGNPTDHLVLLARNETGYKNLLKLVSLSNEVPRFHHMPRIDLDLLEAHSDGLIAQTA
jgi:DNA polymerase-3 subunit alpha